MLKYEEALPCLPLRDHVECYWSLQCDHDLLEELCLPEGSTSLVLNFGPPYSRAFCSDPSNGTVHGKFTLPHQGRESVLISQKAPIDVLGVRFKPYGLSAFYNISMSELQPPFLIEGASLRKFIGPLEETIADAHTTKERLQAIEGFLMSRLPFASHPDNLVMKAVSIMMRQEGNLRISEVLDQLCASKSSLEKKFQESVGLSPKILSNILRFNSLVYKQKQSPLPTLTELTYNKGFFDQSHLVRNFRSFTGMTPSRFFRKEHHLVEMLRQSFEARVNDIY